MKYLAIYASGSEKDRDLFNEVRNVLSMKCNGVLFKDEAECQQAFEEIKVQFPTFCVEWLNGFDCDPKEESIVLSVARDKDTPHGIGYLHFYRCKRTFTPNIEAG